MSGSEASLAAQQDIAGGIWGRLYVEHRRALTVYAASLAGGHEGGMDLLQDVLVRLIGEASIPDTPLPFAMRCLRNLAIDRRRTRNRAGDGDPAVTLAFLAAPPPSEAPREDQRLRAALAAIPDGQREVIVLKIYGEITFAEIAEILARPLGTVTSLYARGIDALRTRLSAEIEHEHRRIGTATPPVAAGNAEPRA